MTIAQTVHLINGELFPESLIRISPRDIGLLRGYGVFDFLITYQGGKPFHLIDHIERLKRSAEVIGLGIPYSTDTLMEWTHKTLEANFDGGEKTIRIVATGGVGIDSITSSETPTILITVDPIPIKLPHHYSEGVGIITKKFRREFPESKSLNYIEGVVEIKKARSLQCLEVLYYDDTQVYEGATSNIFAVIEGRVVTPKSGILPGITRAVLIRELLGECKVHEVDFSLAELKNASEVFLTASNKEVMPVVRMDGDVVGNGKVGARTRQIMEVFKKYTGTFISNF